MFPNPLVNKLSALGLYAGVSEDAAYFQTWGKQGCVSLKSFGCVISTVVSAEVLAFPVCHVESAAAQLVPQLLTSYCYLNMILKIFSIDEQGSYIYEDTGIKTVSLFLGATSLLAAVNFTRVSPQQENEIEILGSLLIMAFQT